MKRTIISAAFCAIITACNFSSSGAASVIKEEIRDELDIEYGRGSQSYSTRTLELERFSSIECNFPCDIHYTQGPQSVELNASDNIIDKIDIKVVNGVLKIGTNANKVRNTGKTRLYISSETLKSFVGNGAVDFHSRGALNVEDFSILVNGASDIDIDNITASNIKLDVNGAAEAEIDRIDCIKLEVYIKGAGDCDLSGRAEDAFVSVSGAAKVDVSDLRASKFNSSVKGAGIIDRD